MHDNEQLRRVARQLRLDIVEQVYRAQSGHPGGALSCADILVWLYWEEMRVDPSRPAAPDRDRFVLSKGHASPALYAALARRGYFSPELLADFRRAGSPLQGHPDMKKLPGVDMSSGSLGQGISAACGMALAARMDQSTRRVYALLGDGETEEGQVWEAVMFAVRHQLENLCVIVDCNGLQIDGTTREVGGVEPLDKKFEGFGCAVEWADGHDFDSLAAAFARARAHRDAPCALLCKTIKGKGVSFMENRVEWHGAAPNDAQYAQAVAELSALHGGEVL